MIARRIRAGVPVDLRTTVGEYLTQWLAERDIAPATRRSYRDHITNHLTPHLGDVLLKDLKTAHIQAMYIAIATRNNEIEQARASTDPTVRATVKGVRPMGAASQQRLRATLRKALNDAISRHKLIEFNPAIHNRWRKTGVKPSKVMVWTPVQAGAFLDHAEAHDEVMYPFYALIMHRGLRRGEACGLQEHDVDLDAAMISVYEQTTSVGYQIERKKPKSEAGRRDSPLAKDTVAILTDYQQRKQRWRNICGTDWPNSPSFFVRPDGTPWHPEYATKRFDKLVKASGLPPIRLHDLRHCAATFMLAAGATLKEIQETLGHASYSVTADIYNSVLPRRRHRRARRRLGSFSHPKSSVIQGVGRALRRNQDGTGVATILVPVLITDDAVASAQPTQTATPPSGRSYARYSRTTTRRGPRPATRPHRDRKPPSYPTRSWFGFPTATTSTTTRTT